MYKRARNPHITDFLHSIDACCQLSKPLFHSQHRNSRKEEPRIAHPDRRESRISECLPSWCPLDWFDPVFFNNMNISFCALYVDAPIALPLPEHCESLDPPPEWKAMPEAEFMEKYGNQVRAKYNLPTEEELNTLYNKEAAEDKPEDDLTPQMHHQELMEEQVCTESMIL